MGCYYIYKGKQYQELDDLYPVLLGEMEEQESVVKVENGKETTVKINTELFPDKKDTGIGTSSNTTEAGKQAIRDVYEKTFNQSEQGLNSPTGNKPKIINPQITSQQKQQAQQKFQEYVNSTGKQDIEGFKEFVGGSNNTSLEQT